MSEFAPEMTGYQSPVAVAEPEFAFNFDLEGIDINEAINSSLVGVASDAELSWNERVARFDNIAKTANSEEFREFVDFSRLLQTMQACCAADMELAQGVEGNPYLAEMLHGHKHDGKEHSEEEERKHNHGKSSTKKDALIMHTARISLRAMSDPLFVSKN